ncbi:class I mannose-6-phosphate isomerase [Lacrimispora indolis]|uniref:class I mannose-6-phosphate isomerase n=1 Tax=Lacrimispora indolis TaxID=69825 RepID=UPI00045E7DF9|nr:class I mannose-6-phosphate isomerase [Lacrimispora indolis]
MIDETQVQQPLLFQDNRIERFYIGGKLLNEWRKAEAGEDTHMCEELLVTSIGAISKGKEEGFAVSRTIEEQGALLLSDIIREYPEEVLGKRFHKYNPSQLTVLARAGDTKVRLVMQCHPKREDARRFFQMHMGKSEAWYIAGTREEEHNLCVYAGFKPHVTRQLWADLIEKQDVPKMLDCLHQIPVRRGQTILIPAGMVHCVGPGCLFLEYHECNDVTVRVERNINQMTLSDEEMFCGLSTDDGLSLFDYTTYTDEQIVHKVIMKERIIEKQEQYIITDLINESDNDSFGIQLAELNGTYVLPEFDGHRILIPVEHDLILREGDKAFRLVQGHAALIPAACKDLRLEGKGCKVTIGIPFISEKENL